jgi:uncharacterized protein
MRQPENPPGTNPRLRIFAYASLLSGVALAAGVSYVSGADTGFAKSLVRDASAKALATKAHQVTIQVDENRPEAMKSAINNARSVVEHYKSRGQKADVEIVTFGAGLHMLRNDTSPVKRHIAQISAEEPSIKFAACANTQASMSRQEQKPVILLAEAQVVPSGVVRLMELQAKGYAYLRP